MYTPLGEQCEASETHGDASTTDGKRQCHQNSTEDSTSYEKLIDENEMLIEEAVANIELVRAARQREKETEDLLHAQKNVVVECRKKINKLQQEQMSLKDEYAIIERSMNQHAAAEKHLKDEHAAAVERLKKEHAATKDGMMKEYDTVIDEYAASEKRLKEECAAIEKRLKSKDYIIAEQDES
jgi:hypothetical protein